MLYQRSKTESENNYFGIYEGGQLSDDTEKQFVEWERLFTTLDPVSLEVFLRKAAGRVAARAIPERGWGQLVDIINEVRGYDYAQSLGYNSCRLLDEQSNPFPDIEASNADAMCLIEVKTIQESDEELRLRGQVQQEESGLPQRLQRVLRTRYFHAVKQIAGHPQAARARKICYMIVTLDLRTVLAEENKDFLQTFIKSLEGEVEIHCISKHWPARPE